MRIAIFIFAVLLPVRCAKVDNQAISEYKFDLGASYGLNGRTDISHDNLQNIIKGAQKGNKGCNSV